MAGGDVETHDATVSEAADSTATKCSRKPDNSAFKQQRLRAWQPILTASTVLPVFFIVAVLFIPIGIVLIVSSSRVQEITIPYTDCNSCSTFLSSTNNTGKTCNCSAVNFELTKAFSGQVYVYYQLTNFYQNHRRYVRSRDDSQLHGSLSLSPNSACKPFRDSSITLNNVTSTLPIAPCGAIANSLFNDSIAIVWTDSGTPEPLVLSSKNIAWKSDRTSKFRNPSIPAGSNKTLADAFAGFAKPDNWQKNVFELDLANSDNNGFLNEDFIVWMRVAAFPTFRKLYRRVVHDTTTFKDGLPKGKYHLEIKYNFPVHSFKGTKAVVLSTTSWIGGKNAFLGIAYLTVGCICLVFGFIFLVIHMKVRTRPLRDWAPTTQ